MAVELLPEQEWSIPFSLVIDDKDDDRGDLVIEQEETGLVVPGKSSKRIASCRVVAIIKRNWRQYCGILQESLPGVRLPTLLQRQHLVFSRLDFICFYRTKNEFREFESKVVKPMN